MSTKASSIPPAQGGGKRAHRRLRVPVELGEIPLASAGDIDVDLSSSPPRAPSSPARRPSSPAPRTSDVPAASGSMPVMTPSELDELAIDVESEPPASRSDRASGAPSDRPSDRSRARDTVPDLSTIGDAAMRFSKPPADPPRAAAEPDGVATDPGESESPDMAIHDDAEVLHDALVIEAEPAREVRVGALPPPPPTKAVSDPPKTGASTDGEGDDTQIIVTARPPLRINGGPPQDPGRIPPPRVPAVPSPRVNERRPRQWWEEFFNEDYMRTWRAPTDAQVKRQCDFIEKSLGLMAGASILDVGCGVGLQAIELASRGYKVAALELSQAMLARANAEAEDRGVPVNFVQGDMRELNSDGAFDAILCIGTTFGYFDDETNRNVLGRFRRALKAQGVLLLESANRDCVITDQPSLMWFEGDSCVCMEETNFNYITSRLNVKRTLILEDRRQRECEYAIRLYPLHELGQLLQASGFRVTEVSGMEATPGVYFGHNSPKLIVLAERREDGATPSVEPSPGPRPTVESIPRPPLRDEKTVPQYRRRSDVPNAPASEPPILPSSEVPPPHEDE